MDLNTALAQIASQINFQNVANGLLVVVLALLSALGIRRGKQQADEGKTGVHETNIITTDTDAMNRLAGSVEALNVTATDIAMMLRKELHDREIDEEVQRRIDARAALRDGWRPGG